MQESERRHGGGGRQEQRLRTGRKPAPGTQREVSDGRAPQERFCQYGPSCRNRAQGCPFRHGLQSGRRCWYGGNCGAEGGWQRFKPRRTGENTSATPIDQFIRAGSRWRTREQAADGAEGAPSWEGTPRRKPAEASNVVSRYPRRIIR